MRLFKGRTAGEAWSEAAAAFLSGGEVRQQSSRSGPTREILHAAFTIREPLERWLLARRPAPNPALAIAETVWMLAGRDDSALPNHWYPGLPEYTGSGERRHGAYGQRLRHRFGFDQLDSAYKVLRNNPDSRQVVLQIWDPRIDLPHESGCAKAQDIPCNVVSMLKVRDDRLEWTQIMRSNDFFLGLPYNFVQFTVLQEVVAGWLGLEVGVYDHFSDSLHVYENNLEELRGYDGHPESTSNTDSLRLPKEHSDEAFSELCQLLDAMTEDDLTEERMRRLMSSSGLPEAFGNLLRIAAADSARRRGWLTLSEEAARECTNEALSRAWELWSSRTRVR